MGKDELKKRNMWQDASGHKATTAEKLFYASFNEHFENTNFKIRSNPNEFNSIYVDFPLEEKVLNEIYQPNEPIKKHGIIPDFAIENTVSKKTLYVEIKRQDGWVENKSRSAGRGNAHERLCKYFTPGLLKIIRKSSNIHEKHLPFWTVFVGDITRDPCRVREITCWFDIYSDHFFFWRDVKNVQNLVNHFDDNLKPLLY